MTQPFPPGHPPGAYPPGSPYGPGAFEERRTSGAAVASLVCGLVGCIPFLSGLGAVGLGVVGIRTTRDPRYSGRGMAVAGLLLGLISLAGWSAFALLIGFGATAVYRESAPAQAVADRFARDLGDGKVDAARSASVAGMDRSTLESAAKRMQPWGPLQSLSFNSVNVRSTPGQVRCKLGGTATFAKATKQLTVSLQRQGAGVYKVESFDFK